MCKIFSEPVPKTTVLLVSFGHLHRRQVDYLSAAMMACYLPLVSLKEDKTIPFLPQFMGIDLGLKFAQPNSGEVVKGADLWRPALGKQRGDCRRRHRANHQLISSVRSSSAAITIQPLAVNVQTTHPANDSRDIHAATEAGCGRRRDRRCHRLSTGSVGGGNIPEVIRKPPNLSRPAKPLDSSGRRKMAARIASLRQNLVSVCPFRWIGTSAKLDRYRSAHNPNRWLG